MKTDKYVDIPFESSAVKTDQFKAFARDFRSDLVNMLKFSVWELVQINYGHFFISGFLHNEETDQIVYFSMSDVRFFPNKWNESLLIRTAKSTNDYTGGVNKYTPFKDLLGAINYMTAKVPF